MDENFNTGANGNTPSEVTVDSTSDNQKHAKVNESTSLSPANNQTYFANERIKVPENEGVSFKYSNNILITF